jgi:hypothetical protein
MTEFPGATAVPDLTPQQLAFAAEYVRNGGDGTAAAIKAGYSTTSAPQRAWELRNKPHVAEAIHREQRRAFTELASISLAQARMMLEDPKTPAGARVELIKTTLDRAGWPRCAALRRTMGRASPYAR